MTSELITSDGKFFPSSALFAVANPSKILPNFGTRNGFDKYFREWKKANVISVQFS